MTTVSETLMADDLRENWDDEQRQTDYQDLLALDEQYYEEEMAYLTEVIRDVLQDMWDNGLYLNQDTVKDVALEQYIAHNHEVDETTEDYLDDILSKIALSID